MVDSAGSNRWDLTAVESLVLLTGPSTSETSAVRAAVLELIVRRALTFSRVEIKSGIFTRTEVDRLAAGPRLHHRHGEPLQTVVNQFLRTAPDQYPDGISAVPIERMVSELLGSAREHSRLRRWWQKSSPQRISYVQGSVLPVLSRRAFFRASSQARSTTFTDANWTITPSGLAKLEQLRGIMANGRNDFRVWVRQDPENARRYLDTAGAAVLLIPSLAPEIRILSTQGAPPAFAEEKSDERHGTTRVNTRATLESMFGLAALAGVFGPGSNDGFDATFFILSEDIERAWSRFEVAFEVGGE